MAICFYPVPGIGLDENASNVFEKRDYCRFRNQALLKSLVSRALLRRSVGAELIRDGDEQRGTQTTALSSARRFA